MKPLPSISQSFSVKFEYKLHFTQHLFSLENPLLVDVLKEYNGHGATKMLFVVDSGVRLGHPNLFETIEAYCGHYSKYIQLTRIIEIEGGEAGKNDRNNLARVLDGINDFGICRHSFVVVIGGGALIDMAGYAAATAHRGVKLIRIPTTVLSQNDAAVGVKNGINEFGKKNFLGTFAPPYAIINDFEFLRTLEQRDWIAGISEAIKVALIKDAAFYQYIQENAKSLADRVDEPMAYVIHRCAEIHMHHIAKGGDPFESGSSRPLDFGHWAAHKLEQLTNYELRHGEAVAMGIALDVTYAQMIGLVDEKVLNSVLDVFETIGFSLEIPIDKDNGIEELLKGIEEFREHLGGELTITLITGIGAKHDVHEIDMDVMRKAIARRSVAREELSL